MALTVEHGAVDLAAGDGAGSGEVLVEEALVVAEVEVRLRAVGRHEHLAVLVGRHGAGVDVEVGVELLDGDRDSAGFQQAPDAGGRDAFTDAADHAAGHKNELRHATPAWGCFANATSVAGGQSNERRARAINLCAPAALSQVCCARPGRLTMLAWSGGGVPWKRRGVGARVEPMAPSQLAPDFDERKAVEQAQSGDQEALSTLYTFYFPRVYRYVAGRVRSTQDAEDVTEEVFLRVVANLKRFEWRGLPFGAWIFRIARNEWSRMRAASAVAVCPRSSPRRSPDTRQDHVVAYELQATIQVVREATARLSPAQRDVIALRFGAGLSVAETASVLRKTENNVKVLQHKAIARLQGMVAEE